MNEDKYKAILKGFEVIRVEQDRGLVNHELIGTLVTILKNL